jgi:hypothetical protein
MSERQVEFPLTRNCRACRWRLIALAMLPLSHGSSQRCAPLPGVFAAYVADLQQQQTAARVALSRNLFVKGVEFHRLD